MKNSDLSQDLIVKIQKLIRGTIARKTLLMSNPGYSAIVIRKRNRENQKRGTVYDSNLISDDFMKELEHYKVKYKSKIENRMKEIEDHKIDRKESEIDGRKSVENELDIDIGEKDTSKIEDSEVRNDVNHSKTSSSEGAAVQFTPQNSEKDGISLKNGDKSEEESDYQEIREESQEKTGTIDCGLENKLEVIVDLNVVSEGLEISEVKKEDLSVEELKMNEIGTNVKDMEPKDRREDDLNRINSKNEEMCINEPVKSNQDVLMSEKTIDNENLQENSNEIEKSIERIAEDVKIQEKMVSEDQISENFNVNSNPHLENTNTTVITPIQNSITEVVSHKLDKSDPFKEEIPVQTENEQIFEIKNEQSNKNLGEKPMDAISFNDILDPKTQILIENDPPIHKTDNSDIRAEQKAQNSRKSKKNKVSKSKPEQSSKILNKQRSKSKPKVISEPLSKNSIVKSSLIQNVEIFPTKPEVNIELPKKLPENKSSSHSMDGASYSTQEFTLIKAKPKVEIELKNSEDTVKIENHATLKKMSLDNSSTIQSNHLHEIKDSTIVETKPKSERSIEKPNLNEIEDAKNEMRYELAQENQSLISNQEILHMKIQSKSEIPNLIEDTSSLKLDLQTEIRTKNLNLIEQNDIPAKNTDIKSPSKTTENIITDPNLKAPSTSPATSSQIYNQTQEYSRETPPKLEDIYKIKNFERKSTGSSLKNQNTNPKIYLEGLESLENQNIIENKNELSEIRKSTPEDLTVLPSKDALEILSESASDISVIMHEESLENTETEKLALIRNDSKSMTVPAPLNPELYTSENQNYPSKILSATPLANSSFSKEYNKKSSFRIPSNAILSLTSEPITHVSDKSLGFLNSNTTAIDSHLPSSLPHLDYIPNDTSKNDPKLRKTLYYPTKNSKNRILPSLEQTPIVYNSKMQKSEIDFIQHNKAFQKAGHNKPKSKSLNPSNLAMTTTTPNVRNFISQELIPTEKSNKKTSDDLEESSIPQSAAMSKKSSSYIRNNSTANYTRKPNNVLTFDRGSPYELEKGMKVLENFFGVKVDVLNGKYNQKLKITKLAKLHDIKLPALQSKKIQKKGL